MAKDTYWFSHDYNARTDGKILKLRMKHSMEGVGVYWCIIEMLYEENGFILLSDYDRISFELRVDESIVKSVINDYGLFEVNSEKFWSNSVLERLGLRKDKSEQARNAINVRWELERQRKALLINTNNTGVLQTNNGSNTIKEKKEEERKEKESKNSEKTSLDFLKDRAKIFYDEVAEFKNDYPKEMLRKFYEYWIEPNKSKTRMRFELEKTWELNLRLKKWSNNNFDKVGVKKDASLPSVSSFKSANELLEKYK